MKHNKRAIPKELWDRKEELLIMVWRGGGGEESVFKDGSLEAVNLVWLFAI